MAKKEKRRAKDRKRHYTYLIRDLKNNKVYYGVHSTDHDPYCIESYHSSSKHLNLIIKEEGFTNFTKEVRRFFSSRKDADLWESKVLRRVDAKYHEYFYNKSNGDANFTATGYATVKVVDTDTFIRVPVDDPYIGTLYHYTGTGVACTDHNKGLLSSLYKGKKWVGEDNPIHSLKENQSFRNKLLTTVGDRTRSGRSTEDLTSEENKKKLLRPKGSLSEEGETNQGMRFRIINPHNRWVYIYDGNLHLKSSEIGNTSLVNKMVKRGDIIQLEIKHPLPSILVASGRRFCSIKEASNFLGCHVNTITNRIKNPYAEDYFRISEEDILVEFENLRIEFKKELNQHYKEWITHSAIHTQNLGEVK